MAHWIALLPDSSRHEAERLSLGWVALQFTPRVAWLEGALVLEVQASARLFGGLARLHARLAEAVAGRGVRRWAWGRTALAASAQARHGEPPQPDRVASRARLATLPLDSLDAVASHAAALAQLGCRGLGDVLQLPRDGLTRRFGPGLLLALDQATGQRPLSLNWLSLPPAFDRRYELHHWLDSAPSLMTAWAPLFEELAAWLRRHQLGVRSLSLYWQHAWRNHAGEQAGRHLVRLSSPMQDAAGLQQLVLEHLRQLPLSAPISDIGLHASDFAPMPVAHGELFPDDPGRGVVSAASRRIRHERLMALLDRLSARLGAERVCRPALKADHRIEHTQRWLPVMAVRPTETPTPPPAPLPTWLLSEPRALPLLPDAGGWRELPSYQGRLTLLAGPHRVEAGWWDDDAEQLVVRDYYLASSPQAGLLWVFKTRPHIAQPTEQWFLHGFFA